MNAQFPTRFRSRHRGIALVLVVCVMALAAILGYAMLSASALQATASGNAVAAAVARAQAESGIHLAMYYLLNPANAPSAPPCTWSNVTFATASPAQTIPGSVTIQVGSPTNNCYTVVATGSSGSSTGGGAVTRTITAKICVGGNYQIQQAGAFNAGVTLTAQSSFINPHALAVASNSAITNNGTINGNIIAPSTPTGTGTQINGSVTISPSTVAPAPTSPGNVYDYTQPYVYQGVTCYPTLIGPTISATTSYSPSSYPNNPLGIFYSSGNLAVNQQLTINGTLIVQGNLTNSSKIYITPVASTMVTNLPALVVNQKLTISGAARVLSATGVVYVGTQIAGSGTTTTSNMTINGALLDSGTVPITGYSGALSVTYNSAYTNIPGFVSATTDAAQTTQWVKIISWSE
jgi:Tfp pilus assembly protein PilX/cytoskeletal protein CcmA (bactofilin family)